MQGENERMNEAHLRICASPEWAAFVESELLPWVLAEADLGDEVLEVGPGPGLTTDVLRRQVPRLTAVEIDERLARSLAGRLAGTNVTVLHADATALPFEAGRFSAATLFTPVDPATMAGRLAGAGFTRVTVEVEEDRFRFAATAPEAGG
jgi:protein-L-isoaspartate O-methyltransferase